MQKELIPVAYKGRGHALEVQCLRNITLSCLILLLSPFYTFSIFDMYMNQELLLTLPPKAKGDMVMVSALVSMHLSVHHTFVRSIAPKLFKRFYWNFIK